MSWIKVVGTGLEVTGVLLQKTSIDDFLSAKLKSIIADRVADKAGDFLKRSPKAKEALWKQFREAAGSETLTNALRSEATRYPQIIGETANQMEPVKVLAGRRVFVVPRFLVNEVALREIRERLLPSQEVKRLEGGETMCSIFCLKVLEDLDGAFASMTPTPSAPVPIFKGWTIVGKDLAFDWHSRDWFGHYYVVCMSTQEITLLFRTHPTQLSDEITALSADLGRLSSDKIGELVRSWLGWLEGKENKPKQFATPLGPLTL